MRRIDVVRPKDCGHGIKMHDVGFAAVLACLIFVLCDRESPSTPYERAWISVDLFTVFHPERLTNQSIEQNR
jgi:hypothetical protein